MIGLEDNGKMEIMIDGLVEMIGFKEVEFQCK